MVEPYGGIKPRLLVGARLQLSLGAPLAAGPSSVVTNRLSCGFLLVQSAPFLMHIVKMNAFRWPACGVLGSMLACKLSGHFALLLVLICRQQQD